MEGKKGQRREKGESYQGRPSGTSPKRLVVAEGLYKKIGKRVSQKAVGVQVEERGEKEDSILYQGGKF